MCYEFISIPHIKEKFGTVWYGTVKAYFSLPQRLVKIYRCST